MKKKFTTFTCDECKKTHTTENEFPYDKKWVYIYSFEFKVSQTKENKNRDKHFCAKHCATQYVLKKLILGDKR